MQPDVLNPHPLARASASELKAVFRKGWSDPQRVQGWVKSGLNSEFLDPDCREAWKSTLWRAVADVPAGPVLDVGTGPGTLSLMWAELGFAVTGVDFSPTMLEMAQLIAGERGARAKFLEGDAEALPFQGEQFTIVSSRFLLFTLPNPGKAIRRWVELLQPGGALVIVGHHLNQGGNKPSSPPRQEVRAGWQPDEEYKDALNQLPFLDHKEGHVRVAMEAAGLCDITSVPVDDLLAARQHYASLHEDRKSDAPPYVLVGRK